jgi:mRNA interferase HicA
LYDHELVRGSEFLRKLQRLARERDIAMQFLPDQGKGSHGRIYFGSQRTAAKDLKKEIGPGLLRKMCKDLGVDPRDL